MISSFIVCFPIGFDFLFITYFLNFFLSWTSSLSISSSAISASTLSNNVLFGLSTGLLPSTLNTIYFFTHYSSLFLITCEYHLSLPLLMTVVIGSTPTNFLNSSLVLLSFMETPHIHLITCISASSYFNPTSDMLDELGWPPLSQMRQEARLIMFYKIINGLAQVPFEGVLIEAYAYKGTRRKHNMKFRQIGLITSQYRQSFSPKTISAWNGLAFAEVSSLAVFRYNFI